MDSRPPFQKEAVIMMLSIPKMEKLLRRRITPEVHWVV